MNQPYTNAAPTRAELDGFLGPTLVEFGADWCGHCNAAQPLIAAALATCPGVRHLKVEDGSGRPLGRSFTVRLWPTLIFFKDGQEIDRLVRPRDFLDIAEALAQICS